MVVSVFGMIDGIKVPFQQTGEGLYQVEFPRKLNSGNYIVEVYVRDDAGNVSYCSTLVCTIDTLGVCIHMEQAKEWLEPVNTQRIRLILNSHEIWINPVEQNIGVSLVSQRIWLEAIPPARCRGGMI